MSQNQAQTERDKLENAYLWGYETTSDNPLSGELENWSEMTEDEQIEEAYLSFEGYSSYAGYANHVLPEMRQAAGFTDTFGVGSYQGEPQDPDYAYEFYGELVDCFQKGYVDGLLGREKDLENLPW